MGAWVGGRICKCNVRDDDDVLASLQLHDDRFEPNNNVAIGLASSVAIVVFVVISGLKVFGVLVGDFLVLLQPVSKSAEESEK